MSAKLIIGAILGEEIETLELAPLLTERRRTDLERLLSVFDQGLRTDNRHALEVDETRMPPEKVIDWTMQWREEGRTEGQAEGRVEGRMEG